jgi:hypothetical protein
MVRNFTGLERPNVKSGPDVFADALVPFLVQFGASRLAGTADARRHGFPKSICAS